MAKTSYVNTVELCKTLGLHHEKIVDLLGYYGLLDKCDPIDIGVTTCYNIDKLTYARFHSLYNDLSDYIPYIPFHLNGHNEKNIQEFCMEHYVFSKDRKRRIEKEVACKVGRIDILTSSHVIEIKNMHNWMHAVGQITIYGSFYPSRHKALILYGNTTIKKAQEILDILARAHIDVVFLGSIKNYVVPKEYVASNFHFGPKSLLFRFRDYLRKSGIKCVNDRNYLKIS